MKIKFAAEVDLGEMGEELEHYKRLAETKGAEPIGVALLELAKISEEDLPGLLVAYTARKKIRGQGDWEDDKLSDMVAGKLGRRIQISAALSSIGHPEAFLDLMGALDVDAVSPYNYTAKVSGFEVIKG